MSHIAAALAKSKGKTVTPPPETTISPSTPGLGVSTPPLPNGAAPSPKSRTPLITGLSVALLLAVAGGYWLTRPAATTPNPVAAPKPAAAPGKVSESVAANKQEQTAVANALAAPKIPAPAVPAPKAEPVAAPAGDFHDAVRQFTIAAVMEGPSGRAVIDGKKVSIGTEVVPGLWLREIKGGRLVFRDAQENEYFRRF